MKKLMIMAILCFSAAVGSAQVTRSATTSSDTIATKAIVPVAPVTGAQRIDAVSRRSASEVNAEQESKQNNQTRAQQKPDPYQKPLTQPATPNGGNATTKP